MKTKLKDIIRFSAKLEKFYPWSVLGNEKRKNNYRAKCIYSEVNSWWLKSDSLLLVFQYPEQFLDVPAILIS